MAQLGGQGKSGQVEGGEETSGGSLRATDVGAALIRELRQPCRWYQGRPGQGWWGELGHRQVRSEGSGRGRTQAERDKTSVIVVGKRRQQRMAAGVFFSGSKSGRTQAAGR